MASDVPTEGLRGDGPDEPLRRDLQRDPAREGGQVEDTAGYERAVEEDAPLPASGEDPGDGGLAPEFREPPERT